MKKNWYGLVDIGIVHSMAYPVTLKGEGPVVETALVIASDEFFNAIEIRRLSDPVLKEKLKKVLKISGIRVIIAGQPTLLIDRLNLNSEDEQERKKAVDDVKSSIDEAVYFGAEKVVVLSGPCPSEDKRENAERLLIMSLKESAKYAKGKNVILSLETFDDKVDKKCLVGNTKQAVRIAEEIKKEYDNFGLTIDLSHLPLLNESPKAALTEAKKVLNHVHIGNCFIKDKSSPYYGDQHPRFSLTGSENNTELLADFLRNLFLTGYLTENMDVLPGIVSMEVKPLPGESSELVIADAKRVWEKAWSLI